MITVMREVRSIKRCLTVLTAVLLTTGLSVADSQTVLERAEREIIVKWREQPVALDAAIFVGALEHHVESVRAALPVTERTTIGLERITVLTARDAAGLEILLSVLCSNPDVEYVERRPQRWVDGRIHENRGGDALDGTPNDPFYPQQWGLQTIEAEGAWSITLGDPSVVIAVVDVGVDFTHPELAHTKWINAVETGGVAGIDDDQNGFIDDSCGYDFIDVDGDPQPAPRNYANSHGTHVAGIASAARNNNRGIAGLAPGCRIMGVRAGSGNSIPYGYEGVYYACRAGARVINCSWGGGAESAYERDIVDFVFEHGSVLVASAGNDNSEQPHYPAAIANVLSVAASRIGDLAANFTNYGSWVQITAPGVHMLSCIMDDNGNHAYDNWQGTSMAAPLVAAECALVASRWPQLSSYAVVQRVFSSADPIDALNEPRTNSLGAGRINAWRALSDSATGVRLVAVDFEESAGNGDGRVRGGESATLHFAIRSDLASAGDVAATIEANADNAFITNPVTVFHDVGIGGPFWNTTQVTVTLNSDVGRGYVLPLNLNFSNVSGLIGRAKAVVHLDSSFVNVSNGQLSLGLGENGCLGYYDYVRDLYIGDGFRIADHANALYHGSVMLAADGFVLDNAYGDTTLHRMDWRVAEDSIAKFIAPTRSDIEARTTFDEVDSTDMLFARVSAAALAWRNNADRGFMVLEYTIRNRSVNPWNETYFGFFLDWDLAGASKNLGAYDPVSQTAYIQQAIPGYPLAGITGITEPWSSFYVIDNRAELTSPAWNDARKWDLLRGGVNDPIADPRDISFLAGVNLNEVAALSERTIAFALVSGQNLGELRANAELARSYYTNKRTTDTPGKWNPIQAKVTPNPLPDGEAARLVLSTEKNVRIRFYNLLGQLVADFPDKKAGPAGVILDARNFAGASGILFYRVDAADIRIGGKLLILK